MHFAAESGNYQSLEILINHIKSKNENKVDSIVNMKDLHGYTALDLVIMNYKKNKSEYNKCIKLLSEYAVSNNKDFVGIDMNFVDNISKQDLFKQFVYDYYKSLERIADTFKDTLPGMHGNCCQTCQEMYHIADKK